MEKTTPTKEPAMMNLRDLALRTGMISSLTASSNDMPLRPVGAKTPGQAWHAKVRAANLREVR